jgi:DNA-3-methyladenine glycosylase II
MFVTAPEALRTLTRSDPVLAHFDIRFPGVRPVLQAEFFTALVRSISAQQVNLRWAATTRRRLAEAFGRTYTLGPYQVIHLDVERLAVAETAELRALQFTTRKSEYIIALARAVAAGELALEALHQAPDDEVTARLTALRGLGRWTADWFLARSLGRPRVVAGDLGVRKAVGAAYLQGRMPSESEVRSHTAHWGEAAGVAQQLLLHALSEGMMNR